MARIETDPNYTTPTFSRATAAADIFKKEDVQLLASAISTHDHTAGKGLKITAAAFTPPIDINGMFRSQGQTGSIGSGKGIEISYDTSASDRGVIMTYDRTGSAYKPLLIAASNMTFSITGGSNFVLDAGGQGIFSGSVSVGGNLTAANGNLYVRDASGGGVAGTIYLGDAAVQRWNPTQVRITGAGGLTIQGPVAIESDQSVTFSVNGYGFKGISSFAGVTTTAGGNLVIDGGSLWLNAGRTARAYWDGSFVNHQPAVASNGHFYAQGGTYYAGATNQSSIQMWNPGEWRVSSTPGNLYVLGLFTAEGGTVTGKGAYVNSLSSITVKTAVAELDPAESLAQVMDARMRPVNYQLTTPPPQTMVLPPDLGKDAKDAVPEDAVPVTWTDDRLGFIAEEVAVVVPQAAGIIEGTAVAHGLIIEALVPVLWAAVRALAARVETLEAA